MNEPCPILLFDGVCNLCNGLVVFIIRRDKNARIKFTPLQSPAGETILIGHSLAFREMNSIVLLDGSKLYKKSSAVLHLLKTLGGGWCLFYGFIIIPGFIRDFFYDLIAKNRYRIFGKTDVCMVPSPDFSDRFIR